MFKKMARRKASMTKAYYIYNRKVTNGRAGRGKKSWGKRIKKKLTERIALIDFSARQHGDGQKSPAVKDLENRG